ncbi:hypothetical protein L1987_51543 [Smallanthus sonchifolius]|uniref:Uncharacterized protein n=1 Tax=Smallanthus sonchifolius TaxID=185202 RepID=A0ACB9ER74_9ASTR|nr:hypothetical protein L1987_51543 [Smallanthus sonchifolius]
MPPSTTGHPPPTPPTPARHHRFNAVTARRHPHPSAVTTTPPPQLPLNWVFHKRTNPTALTLSAIQPLSSSACTSAHSLTVDDFSVTYKSHLLRYQRFQTSTNSLAKYYQILTFDSFQNVIVNLSCEIKHEKLHSEAKRRNLRYIN